MNSDYWFRQTAEKPLFPDLLWSRPENKAHAGKLLVIGGNSFGFSAVGEAYTEAGKAGVGTVRVLLPNAIKKVAGLVLQNGEFAPSTPSGSFSQAALADWLEHAGWADGVLIAGDLAKNSETAIVLEKFLQKYPDPVTITKDAGDYVASNPKLALNRNNTLLVVSFAQLQKTITASGFAKAITFDMGVVKLVEVLHEFTTRYSVLLVVKQLDTLYIAVNGQVSTTPSDGTDDIWRVKTAAHASVWWLQNPDKPFEAITTSLSEIKNDQ
jgi:NAD(P)H-hydrate repair Nnr-like enzyme with NAD(P)H-hydrate dehydratase domain